MRQEERESLRLRFQFRCGYCGVGEQDVGAQLTVDHFQPRSRGGVDEAENWVYCCHACNEFKGDFWQPNSPQRVLHPLRDAMALHVVEREDGTLEGLSETGGFHINMLKLNRSPLVAYRQERRLIVAARQAQARILNRVERIEEQMQALTARLQQLERGDQDT